jgi:basic membrane lipoprotein Med (substrate-binding protein (PBP1-ABC) superfamily)
MVDFRNLSRRRFLELGAAAGASLGLSGAGLIGSARAAAPLPAVAEEDAVIAFAFVGPASDEGWTWTHDQGRQAVQAAFPKAKTIFVENVPYSADASRTFRQFVSEGAQMIITNSNYGDFLYDVAKSAPEVAFLHCDDRQIQDNIGVFYPSHWYPSYVTGVAAGAMSTSNKLGYIASFPVPTSFTGSNAFLMGARSVKPEATLQVVVINSWFDPQASTQAARALIDNGADVLFGIMDEPGYLQVAEQLGKKAVMLNTDSRKYGPKAYVSSIMFDFRKFYTEQVRARLEGRWTSGQFLLPFGDGTDRDAWGETVPADAAKVADEARSKILGGWSPFAGEIRDNKGTVKVAAGHTMSETEIYNWNWPIDGISGL